MLARRNELERLSVAVVLVAYDECSLLEAKMLQGVDVPFPLLLDRDKSTYRAWGMGRTNAFAAMLSPSLNWRYLKLLLRGERFLGVAPDMFQLGGDFVLDRQGRITFEHRMRNAGDRAAVSDVMDAVRNTVDQAR